MKDANLHQGHWERLRQKVMNQEPKNLTDKEVLELCLQYVFSRGDINEIASRLLAKFGNFAKVFNATKDELKSVKGIGDAAADKLLLLPKIFNYYNISIAKEQNTFLDCNEKCINLAKKFLYGLKQERLYMFCMDSSSRVVKEISLGISGDSYVNVSINEILIAAMQNKAKYVFFAHNHPNGILKPSDQDMCFTKQVCQILCLSGIIVTDHIITFNEQHYSIKNTGMIDEFIKAAKSI